MARRKRTVSLAERDAASARMTPERIAKMAAGKLAAEAARREAGARQWEAEAAVWDRSAQYLMAEWAMRCATEVRNGDRPVPPPKEDRITLESPEG